MVDAVWVVNGFRCVFVCFISVDFGRFLRKLLFPLWLSRIHNGVGKFRLVFRLKLKWVCFVVRSNFTSFGTVNIANDIQVFMYHRFVCRGKRKFGINLLVICQKSDSLSRVARRLYY